MFAGKPFLSCHLNVSFVSELSILATLESFVKFYIEDQGQFANLSLNTIAAIGFMGRAIDIPLFRRQLKNIGINLTKNEANAVYSLYDKDGNGQLEYREFLKGFFSDHLPVYEQAASAQPSMAQHFATIESYEHAQSPLSHQQQQYQQYPSYTQHHYLEPNSMHAANNVSQSSWSAGPYSSDASINFQHQSNNVVLPPPPISHSEEADFDYSGDLSESFFKTLRI